MSQSNHYSLASPTSLLIDDSQIIERVFSHIDNKTTDLGSEVWREPVKNYVDQERFNKEIKLLRSQPVPFCPSSALPEKGSYVSRIAAGTPILVTRDEEGKVNAFINACRHRGMQVASGSGCKKSFVCPYHGWTYGLKGENRHIPGSDGAAPVQNIGAYGVEISSFISSIECFNLKTKKYYENKSANQIDLFTEEEETQNDIIEDIKEKLSKDLASHEVIRLEKRLAILSARIAIVKVGANSDIELKEKTDRVEDAICATKAAIKEGIVPGGGIALLNASTSIVSKTKGEEVLLEAIRAPFKTILENAAISYAEFPNAKGRCLNVVTGQMLNMINTVIIDPFFVTNSSLQNSASVATTILSTACVINNL